MGNKDIRLEPLLKKSSVPEGTIVAESFRELGMRIRFLKKFTFDNQQDAEKRKQELAEGAAFFKMLHDRYGLAYLPIKLEVKFDGKWVVEVRRSIIKGNSLDALGPLLNKEDVAELDLFFEGFLLFYDDVLNGKQQKFWFDFNNENLFYGYPERVNERQLKKHVYPSDYDPEWILDYSRETMEQFFASFTQLLDSLRSFEKMAKSSNIDFVFLRSNKVLLKFIESIKRGKAKLTTSALEVLTPFIKLEE